MSKRDMLCIWKPSQSRTSYSGNRGAQPDIYGLMVASQGCCDFSQHRGSMSLLSRVGALGGIYEAKSCGNF